SPWCASPAAGAAFAGVVRRAMELGPRHPRAPPPATGPASLPCGAVLRRRGPLSPPDRVPACGGTPPGHRQTHHTPDRPPLAACRVSASCRALPSPHQRGRTATRDDTRTHEQLPVFSAKYPPVHVLGKGLQSLVGAPQPEDVRDRS